MGMAVFTDPFIDTFGLSRTQLSMAYLLGTVGSSLFLTRAGRLFDRFGGRLTIALSSFALGLMLVFISLVDSLAALLGNYTWLTFLLILLGYFGVRFFGQGMLTSCSRNVLLLWFVKRRGLVSGVRGVFVSFGFSLAPLVLGYLIGVYGWRGALWLLAVSVGVIFAAAALIFVRDNPVACGVLADGDADGRSDALSGESVSQPLHVARRSPVFWIYSVSLGVHAFFGTAVTFHVVSIFEAAGRDREEAFAYFFPMAVFATSVNLVASWLVDSYPLKPFLLVMLMTLITGAVGLLHLDQTWGFWMMAAGLGTGGGLWGVTSNLAFIRFFGPLHVGEISGLNTSITVFASAVGPAAFSLGLDYLGSYNEAVKICIGLVAVLLVVAMLIKQRKPSLAVTSK